MLWSYHYNIQWAAYDGVHMSLTFLLAFPVQSWVILRILRGDVTTITRWTRVITLRLTKNISAGFLLPGQRLIGTMGDVVHLRPVQRLDQNRESTCVRKGRLLL